MGINLGDGECCAVDIEHLLFLEGDELEHRLGDPSLDSMRAEASGLDLPFIFAYTLPPHPEKLFSLVYLPSRSNLMLEIIHSSLDKRTHTMAVAVSPLRSGGELVTVLKPNKGMDSDEKDDVEILKRGSLEDLVTRHGARAERTATWNLPEPRELPNYLLRRNQRALERFVRRGLYVRLEGTPTAVQPRLR
jgi:hypothetical protein